MLNKIRNLNYGWILIPIGIVAIFSGIRMKEGNVVKNTFYCFDNGCIYVQGISNIVIGMLVIILGIYLIAKK
jgi:uncharacterized membrane protein